MGWIRSNRSDEGPREQADRLAAIAPGVPGHCPACDGLGYIDNIDLGHRYQIQHCKDCGHRWEYLFDRDGAVVGLTELDDRGQPRSRSRIRPLRAAAPAAGVVAESAEVAATDGAAGVADVEIVEEAPDESSRAAEPAPVDDVIDLREPEPEPVPVPAHPQVEGAPGPEAMSPAEWLRHSLRR